jgi:hypothetical protein
MVIPVDFRPRPSRFMLSGAQGSEDARGAGLPQGCKTGEHLRRRLAGKRLFPGRAHLRFLASAAGCDGAG